MNDKKYYSNSEVSKILNINHNQLRYLEKILSHITIYKIRNRKYYTAEDIEHFKSYIMKNMDSVQLTMPIEPQRCESVTENFEKPTSLTESVRVALLYEPDMLTSTYYLQNEHNVISNQLITDKKLPEKSLDLATPCVYEDDMPLFALASRENILSKFNDEDLGQSSVTKLSDDRLQQINNLIKNLRDLSLFIEQALSS
ncbi:MAG: MerR family transcriptional regulator [Candidatus Rickettsia vulgarisii]